MSVFLVEVERNIATLWLANPDRRNAMGPEFWDELPQRVAELDTDDRVRVVVVAAQGAHFSVGLDLVRMGGELATLLQGGLAKERLRLFDVIAKMRRGFDAIASSRKPFIAAVHGACLGGGLDLISACDIRLAAQDARFSLRETKIAIVADMGSLQRLRGTLPEGMLRELAFTGRDMLADEALRVGLVNRVCATANETREASLQLAEQIAENSPLAVQGTKEVLNFSDAYGKDAGLRFVAAWNAGMLASKDLVEAMTAFAEKRAAKFSGE